MVDPIKGGLGPAAGLNGSRQGDPANAGGEGFGELLKDSMDKVNNLQTEADRAIEKLASGEAKNIHETMIAVEKANLSFNLMVQVRNKLLTAYEEVMRMQV